LQPAPREIRSAEGMMGRTFLVLAITVLTAASGAAQTNTTGSISPNTSVLQAQQTPGVTPGATPPPPATTPTAPTLTAPSAGRTSSTTSTTTGARDAAIVVCGEDISTGTTRLVVFSSSTSTGAPTIAAASPCAQVLADLFVAGFGLLDVQPLNQQLQYTLVR
jgi:hypothetical protein